jgi:hypothetical protein
MKTIRTVQALLFAAAFAGMAAPATAQSQPSWMK